MYNEIFKMYIEFKEIKILICKNLINLQPQIKIKTFTVSGFSPNKEISPNTDVVNVFCQILF